MPTQRVLEHHEAVSAVAAGAVAGAGGAGAAAAAAAADASVVGGAPPADLAQQAAAMMMPPPPPVHPAVVSNEVALARERMGLGLCEHCSAQTYVLVRDPNGHELSRQPLTIPGEVHRGRCLHCNPLFHHHAGGGVNGDEHSAFVSQASAAEYNNSGSRASPQNDDAIDNDNSAGVGAFNPPEEEEEDAAAAMEEADDDDSHSPMQVDPSSVPTSGTNQTSGESDEHSASLQQKNSAQDLQASPATDADDAGSAARSAARSAAGSVPSQNEVTSGVTTDGHNDGAEADNATTATAAINAASNVPLGDIEAISSAVEQQQTTSSTTSSNRAREIPARPVIRADEPTLQNVLQRLGETDSEDDSSLAAWGAFGAETAFAKKRKGDESLSAKGEKEADRNVKQREADVASAAPSLVEKENPVFDERKETNNTSGEMSSSRLSKDDGRVSEDDEKSEGTQTTKRRNPRRSVAGAKRSSNGVAAQNEKDKKAKKSPPRSKRKSVLDKEKEVIAEIQGAKYEPRNESRQLKFLKYCLKKSNTCDNYELVLKHHGASVIFDAMHNCADSVEVLTLSFEALVHLIYYDSRGRIEKHLPNSAKLTEEILRPLRRHPTSITLHEQGIGVLQQLANTNTSKLTHDIVSSGCVKEVIKSMHSFADSLQIQDTSCLFLQDLLADTTLVDTASVLACGALQRIVSALQKFKTHPKSMQILESGLGAITNAFRDEALDAKWQKLAITMLDQELLKILKDSVRSKSSKVVVITLNALNNIATEEENVNRVLTEEGVVALAVKAMNKYSSDREVQKNACILLRTFGIDSGRGIKIAEEGGSSAIIDCISSYLDDLDVLNEALGALRNVAHCQRRSPPETVGLILNAMNKYQSDSNVQQHCCHLLNQYMDLAWEEIQKSGGESLANAKATFPGLCEEIVDTVTKKIAEKAGQEFLVDTAVIV